MDWKDPFPRNNRFFETDNGILYRGDAKDLLPLIPADTVNLVLTDPPYIKKYLFTYEYLAQYCPPIMKNGASLVTIVGHYAIPIVMDLFRNKLKYRWIFCMNQEDGPHPRMAMGVEVLWKPVLWYVKKAYPQGRGFIKDMLHVPPQKKIWHKWEQSTDWANFFVSKLSTPDNTILDPFIGGGTTAVACENLGRRWIGIEIDAKQCERVQERLLMVKHNRQARLLF